MLSPLQQFLSSHRLVLASASPRRREILTKQGGLDGLEVVPSDVDESTVDKGLQPGTFVEELAVKKAKEVWQRLISSGHDVKSKGLIVVGSDTVIYTPEGKIMGKPETKEEAFTMLKSLSGRSHSVYSGVAVYASFLEEPLTLHESTGVVFGELSDEVVRAYVETGEPMDKAGGYGIQGQGGSLVRGIEGDYYNVMGFPLHAFCCAFAEAVKKAQARKGDN